jgi:hypothetical protein
VILYIDNPLLTLNKFNVRKIVSTISFQASPTDNGLLQDEDSMRLDDGVFSPEDSDLAQLRSLNDTELSADWYNFQVRLSL